jgi:hypothetical protein
MPNDLPFRVSWTRETTEALKEFVRKARESGGGNQLVEAIRIIDERLRRDPAGLGEIYRSAGAVEVYLAVCNSVAINFSVDTVRMFVLVWDCNLLSGPEL